MAATGFELSHSWQVYVFTAAGALVLWGKIGRENVRAFVLADLLDKLFAEDNLARRLTELGLFLSIGTILGVGFLAPATPQQAIAAGLGWTGLFATPGRQNEDDDQH